MTAIILFGTMIVLLIIGVPISVSLGAATMASLLCFDVPMAVVPQRMFTALDSVSIMAIPLFVLAGNLMTEGGISRRLVDFCNSIIGNIRGGMGYAMVLACAFFAALSGSAPATVLAIGGMLYPDMVRLGYPKERCAGLLTVSGGLGPIIPPSIIMVVYCTITNSSVGDMFKGGIVAGLMISIVLVVICIYYSNKEKWPKNTERTSVSQLAKHFIHALPALFLPFVILGGIYSGLMTPTESAAVAVIYSFIVSVFVYRELHPGYLPYTSGLRKEQCHDFIHHCNLHSIFMAVYILGDIRTAGGCNCGHESGSMDVLSDCCPGIACVRHIPGGDSYLCASGTGSLAHSTDPGNWRHSFWNDYVYSECYWMYDSSCGSKSVCGSLCLKIKNG